MGRREVAQDGQELQSQMLHTSLNDREWDQLELAVRAGVAAGGFAAMGYYREALGRNTALDESKNPATEADVQATAAVLRTLDPPLRAALRGRVGRVYFAEELADLEARDRLRRNRMREVVADLGSIQSHVECSREGFVQAFPTAACVLLDGLDGTTSFGAGIPLFCCAVAVFLDGRPRVAALYDAIHHVVYYGSHRGDGAGRSDGSAAWMWQVSSGTRVRMPFLDTSRRRRPLIGTHLTRSDEQAFEAALAKIGRSGRGSGGVYMLNSGQLALAYVASGSLSTFFNNYTHVWDVAAGEVLVRAAGGEMTDFADRAIDYARGAPGEASRIEVLASADRTIHNQMIQALK